MKLTLLLAIMVSIFTFGCSHDEIENGVLKKGKMVLKVDSAGTLSKLISTTDKYSITDLTLSGNIDGKDIMFIREIAGLDSLGIATGGRLTKINLGNANIVAGGYFYYKVHWDNSYGFPSNFIGKAAVLKNDEAPEFMFYDLEKITSVILPKSTNYINNNAFGCCAELTTVEFSDKVTYIGSAFVNCTKLNSITLPNALNTIASTAFSNCTGLTSVTIPNSVISINGYAFNKCTGLTSITIGNNVTNIGSGCFSNCFNIAEIHCRALNPPKVVYNAFSTLVVEGCKLYIPKGYSQAYKSAEVWKEFVNVIEE